MNQTPETSTGYGFMSRALKLLACILVYLAVFSADEYCMNHSLVSPSTGMSFLLIFTFSALVLALAAFFFYPNQKKKW